MKWVGEARKGEGGGGREDNVSSGTIGRRVVLVDGSRGILPPDNARLPPDNVYCHNCFWKWNKTKTILT